MNTVEIEKALDSSEELQITVTGRKTGRQRSAPVWFVREGKTIFLMPTQGSRNQWYKNIQKTKQMKISSGKISFDSTVKPITDQKIVASVVEKFRKKHGVADVKRYYSVFDVAVELKLP